MRAVHNIFDITLATVAVVVAVSIFYPIYLVVVPVKTVVKLLRSPS